MTKIDDLLGKIVSVGNKFLPNNPINKLTQLNNTLKNNTTLQNVQKIDPTVWKDTNGNQVSVVDAIKNTSTSNLLTGKINATPSVNQTKFNNIYSNVQDKVTSIPTSNGKQNFYGNLATAINSNQQQESMLNSLQKAFYNTDGTLTREEINQWINDSGVKNVFPKVNADDILSLQSDITPILKQSGQFVDNAQIAEKYPNLYTKKNIEELTQKSQDAQNKWQELVNKVSKANPNVLSDAGKSLYNFIQDSKSIPEQIREQYNVSSDVTDAELVSTVWANDEAWKERYEMVKRKKSKMNSEDRSQLGLSSKFESFVNNLFKGMFINPVLTSTSFNQGVNALKNAWDNNVQPFIDRGRQENPSTFDWIGRGTNAVADVASMPGNLLGGISKISNNATNLTSINPNKSLKENFNEKTGELIKLGGGTIETLFNSWLAPATALFHVAGEVPVAGDILNWGFGLIPDAVDQILSGKWRGNNIGATSGENQELPVESWISDWYNNGLDDEERQDLQNEVFILLAHKIAKSGKLKKLGADSTAFGKTLIESIQDAIQVGRYASSLDLWLKRQQRGGNVYEERYGLPGGEDGNPPRGGAMTVDTGEFKEGKNTFGDIVDSAKTGVQAGLGRFVDNLKTGSEFNRRLDQRLNKITADREKAKVTEGVKEEVGDLENEIRRENNIGGQLADLQTKVDENVRNEEIAKGLRKPTTSFDSIKEKFTGLDDATREQIKKNPFATDEVRRIVEALENDEALDFGEYEIGRYQEALNTIIKKIDEVETKRTEDIGPLYQLLEQINTPVDTSNLLGDLSSFVRDLSENISSGERNKINEILDRVREGNIDDISALWELRKLADKYSNWEANSTTEGINAIRGIRDRIDSIIRDQVPEFKEVDSSYVQVLKDLQDLRGKLYTKKNGRFQLRDNAVSTVKNLLNPANRLYLERLEKHIPGLTQYLNGLKQIKKVYNAYTTGNGSRFISGIAQAIGGKIGRIVGALAGGAGGFFLGALADGTIDAFMKNFTKKAIKDTLTKMTPEGIKELQKIADKVKAGKELTKAEKERLKELSKKIIEEGKRRAETKAEKEYWEKVERAQQKFNESVESDNRKNKLTDQRKPGDKGKTEVTGDATNIVVDEEGNARRKGQIGESDKRSEENKKNGYMNKEQQQLAKVDNAQRKLQAGLDRIGDNFEEGQRKALTKDVEDLRREIKTAEENGYEVPQEVRDTLAKAEGILGKSSKNSQQDIQTGDTSNPKTPITGGGKTAVTGGTKTAVLDKTETPQQKAQDIIQQGKTTNKTAITTKKSDKGLTNVQKFRKETEKYYPNYKLVESDALNRAQDILDYYDVPAEIVDLVFTGSLSRGLQHNTSDTDILIELKGKNGERIREDNLFDILNDGDLNDGEFDFNPIVADKSGTLEDVIVKHEQHLKQKGLFKDELDKIGVKWDKKTADDTVIISKTMQDLFINFLKRTDGPVNVWKEGKGWRASAHDKGAGEYQVFSMGANTDLSPAEKRLLDKIQEARKNQKIEIGKVKGYDEDEEEQENKTAITGNKTAVTAKGQKIKPQLEQGEVKGEMYHVTPEDFEKFKEGDTANGIDWNTAFGTFVTDSKPFLEDFKKIKDTRGEGGDWKTKTLQIDAKNVILHPYDLGSALGYDSKVAEGILIDYLQKVGRFDLDTQKDLIGLKFLDIGGETYENWDYDTYPRKDNYTKEEILAMPGSIYGGIKDTWFEGDDHNDYLFGDHAEEDAQKLKELGYDAVQFYEGTKDGEDIYSYALFYPNRYLENKNKVTSDENEATKNKLTASNNKATKVTPTKNPITNTKTAVTDNSFQAVLNKMPDDGRNFLLYFKEGKKFRVGGGKLVYAHLYKKEHIEKMLPELDNHVEAGVEYQIRDSKGNIYYQSTGTSTTIKEDNERAEAEKRERAEQARLQERAKRINVIEFIEGNYQGMGQVGAMTALTKKLNELGRGYSLDNETKTGKKLRDENDNLEYWQALDIIAKQPKVTLHEVWESGSGENEKNSYWVRINSRKEENGITYDDYNARLNKYAYDYIDYRLGKIEDENNEEVVDEDLKSLFKPGGTTVKTGEEHENAFGLKPQKNSSRINRFSNVVMKIIDKYQDQIETIDGVGGITKELFIKKGENYLPLLIQFDKEKNQLMVRHTNMGYDDPAMLFKITPEGGLKALGIKQAFMEQYYNQWDWSKLSDTDEMLHVRAVNLEDQYLGTNTIDEDTGEVKEPKTASEVTKSNNAVTQVKAPESKTKVTEKTTTDKNHIKELADKKGLLSFRDGRAYTDDVFGEYEYTYETNRIESKGVLIAKMNTQDRLGIEEGDALLTELLERAIMDGDLEIDMNGNVINHSNYDSVQIYNSVSSESDGKPTSGSRIITFMKLAKHSDETEFGGRMLLSRFLKERGEKIQQAQPIDNTQKNNITTNNKNVLTSNNNINGGSKTNSGEEYEGQNKFSDTSKTILTNDGGTKVTADSGVVSTGAKTMNTSSDSVSKSGDGSRTGGSNVKIWEKGNDVITSKTVTQARDINRECVSILEKHNYSTNPKDYTEDEINTLKQYEGRGGVNDKQDSKTQGALNQYYTKDNIIKAMWRLVDGYDNKDILEPSMGVGRFFMYAPENANLFGFEYDKIPGTIAQILYPNADIKIMDFQDNFMAGKYSVGENYRGRKYDLIIGNPPYEERQGRQRGLGEEPKINRFDDYFIKRGIDMLKPGGHLIFVTSSQFLRGADNYAKQKISENAQLIDAYRIPIGAFDRTGVETDIVLFEKNGNGGDKSNLSASKWFIEHPDKILGEEQDVEGRFGIKKGVVGDISAIDNIASTRVTKTDGEPAILEQTFTPTEKVEKQAPVTTKTIEAKKENKPKKTFSNDEWQDWVETRVNDDGTQETITLGKSLNGVVFKGNGGKTGTLTVGKGGIGKYQKLLNANGKVGDPDIKLSDDREGLNYIKGELEPNILYASGHIPTKLEQLEKDYKGGFIDERQYNKQKDLLEQAKPEEIGYQDIYFSPYIDWLLDFDTNEITTVRTREGMKDVKSSIRSVFKKYINEKINSYRIINYKDSKGETQTANAGYVMLDILNKGKEFPKSAKERVATLYPNEFNSFMKGYTLDSDTKSRIQKAYNDLYNSYANFDYSGLGLTVEDISRTFRGNDFALSDVQSRGIARILTTEAMIIAFGVGQGKTIVGIIGAIASMQQGKARKAIIIIPAGTKSGWMQTVAQLFPNQEMIDLGSLARGTGIRKKLVDMFGPDPRDWIQDGQIVFLEHSAIGRQISFKNDTLTELEQNLTDVMESNFEVEKNINNAKKKLETQEKALEKAQQKGASASDIEKKQKQMEDLIASIEQMGGKTENPLQDIINTYKDQGANEDIITEAVSTIDKDYDEYIHDMNAFIDNQINVGQAQIDKEKALKVVNDIFTNERAIYLEDLGIDHMTVDEAHNFRNLFNKAIQDDDDGGSYHAGTNVKEGSKQAKNLYAMSQYIMGKNGGGNVVLLTATPFINDPSEMYNMLSYVGKNGLVEMGVENIDSFYDNFVGLENRMSPTASTSGVEYKNVMVGFNNTETLVKNLLDRYVDYEGESLNIVKPRLVTNVIRLNMSSVQKKIETLLEEQIDSGEYNDEWEGVSLGKTRKTNDAGKELGAVLEGMQQANLNLISPYLTKYLKDQLATLTWKDMIETSPKLKAVIDIIKLQRDMGIFRGTFVYMEQGKELHELLKKAIEESIPGVKVGIINGDKKYSDLTEAQAKKLGVSAKGAKARLTAKQFHDGEIDVLIGGANTKEGIELQGNGYHLIEVSQPWNMNDRIQLNGRMWRQGNLSNEVLDTLLLMNDSSDIYRFELMARKEARWNILEMLSAYKRGEKIEDVKVDGELDMNEEKLALFTDPAKKAKVSIVIEESELKEEESQINGQKANIEKLINIMSNWGNDYGWYRKLGQGVGNMDKLYDENNKAVTTNILDENALEPLEQQLQYARDEAMKDMIKVKERWGEKRTKAEMEKRIRDNDPYSYSAFRRDEINNKLKQARSERNLVIRQTNALGMSSIEELNDYLKNLEEKSGVIKEKISKIQDTFNEKVEYFKDLQARNKEFELDDESILQDLAEDFKHQVTLPNKEALRNWIELTKDLPKREQARTKTAITGGKNKYTWKSEDYMGKKATFEKPKNLITSQFKEYSNEYQKPEIKYVGYIPKEIIKTKDGRTLTRIGFQDQFFSMNYKLREIKRKYIQKENEKPSWKRDDISEILARDEYYQSLKTRLSNMILKFAQRFDEEIIKAFKKDNPGITNPTVEDFYNYINDYHVAGDEVVKIDDEYVKQGAEYLLEKFNNSGNSKNSLTSSGKNKLTNL